MCGNKLKMDNEKKIDNDWLATLRGDEVLKSDKKWKLQAKLLRAIIQKLNIEYDHSYELNKDERLRQFKKLLLKEGVIKNKSSIRNKITKWLSILFFSVTVVWATNELIRYENPLHVDNNEIKQSKIKNEKSFSYIQDKYGSFIGFWSKLQLKTISPQNFEQPLQINNSECGPEKITLEGCLVLANDNENAMFNIGLMYEKGIGGVEQNYKNASEWYKKAEMFGSKEATFNLEYLYQNQLIN